MEKKLGVAINFDHLPRLLLGKAISMAIKANKDGESFTLRYDNGASTTTEVLISNAGVMLRQKITSTGASFIDFDYGTPAIDDGLYLPSKINILAKYNQPIRLEISYD